MNEKTWKKSVVSKKKIHSTKNKSLNDMPVLAMDPKLNRWIKIIHPTKSSLHTERME